MKSKLLLLLMLIGIAAKSQNYLPEKQKNVTVVYFVPTDYTASVSPSTYQDRLSKVLIYIQGWYSQQMKNNGYTDVNGNGKTFGLIKDASTQLVDIVQINAPNPSSSYNSYGNIKTAVENYFSLNPTKKTGKHVLVFYPNGMSGPYTGYNQYTTIPDDPIKTNINKVGTTDVAGLGGPAHELGHGLNLPHDSGTKSDYTNPARGTSLMGACVYNFSRTDAPAFLTATDCAILNATEPFADNPSIVTYASVNSLITSVHAIYDAATRIIKVSGKFSDGGVPVNSVAVYNDPNYYVTYGNNQGYEGVGTNVDYNAITWETKVIGTDSFYVDIPIDEFTIRYPYEANGVDPFNYPYEMKFKFVHNNGFTESDNGGAGGSVRNTYYFTFANGVPVLPFSIPSNNTALVRSGWTATAGNKTINGVTFVDQSDVAQNMLDDDFSSFWHSKWYGFPTGVTANPYPHEFVIDTKVKRNYAGWSYHHRAGNQTMAKTADLYGSDDNANWILIKNYTFEGQAGVRYFPFDSYKNFRYFKFVALSSFSGEHTAIADFKLYSGPDPTTTAPVIPTNTLVSTNGWTVKAGTKTRTDGVTNYEDENNATTSGGERAENIIDNNASTFWHSKYSGLTSSTTNGVTTDERSFPHQITIDTKSIQRFTSWSYVQRANGSVTSRAIKDATIAVSNDDVNYTLVSDLTLLDNIAKNQIQFGVKNFRYFRIIAKNAVDGQAFAALAEVSLYNDLNVNTTLPVDLIAFTAKPVANTVKLNWTTASESNSAYFDVMRLANDGSAVSVGKVSAVGSSSSKLNYNYTDFNPLPGTSYYQLQQYDKDGKMAVKSEIVAVHILENPRQLTVQSVNAGEVIFNVYSATPVVTSFYITNVSGQHLASKTVNLTVGNNQLSLPVNGIGLHILTADFKSERISKKFIK